MRMLLLGAFSQNARALSQMLTRSRMSSRALRFWRLAVLGPGLPPEPEPLLQRSAGARLAGVLPRRARWLPSGDPNASAWLRLTALPDLQPMSSAVSPHRSLECTSCH